MKKTNLLIFALFIIVATLGLTLFLQDSPQPEPQIEKRPVGPVEKPEKKPIVHYPVPEVMKNESKEAPEKKPMQAEPAPPILPEILPPVEESDKSIEQAIDNLKIKKSLFQLILLENFIQRFVVTIDNLPEKKLPRTHLPIVPPKGRFVTSGTADNPQTSKRNSSRYGGHLQLLTALNQDVTIDIYVHFYPLFQTAYEQLGYRNAYFNDRLVYVIDHLLRTPEPPEPIPLTQPLIQYQYADPLLEDLSSGQKILLRIGPEQSKTLRELLKSYRSALIQLQP